MTNREVVDKKENAAKEKGKEKSEKKEELSKKAKPLAESLMVLTASAALALGACGAPKNDRVDEDADSDVEEEVDVSDEDALEDVDEVTDAEDEMDVAEDLDAVEDSATDVEEEEAEDAVEEDVELVCEAYDESRTIMVGTDDPMTVGGIDIVYKGLDTEGKALYDIYCGDVEIRSGVAVAVEGSETVNVPEQRFRVTLSPSNAYAWSTTVNVSVERI